MASNENQQRTRLIDHFKRAYQVIVGLALTLACSNVLPFAINVPFWMFCTLFITIMPIFHGGDRSLDIKYLDRSIVGWKERFSYVWDVYMLLITGIFFVRVALAIPGQGLGSARPLSSPQGFYWWMFALFAFDVFVLIVDGCKSTLLPQERRAALSAYPKWVALNAVMALVCIFAATRREITQGLAIFVFACALTRSIIDYVLSQDFLFP